MSSHTPGKWEVIKGYDGFTITGIGYPKIQVEVCRFERNSVSRDDARLMAAAPELLETLKKLHEMYSDFSRSSFDLAEIRKMISTAIANAEGKS